ncbi:MAG: cob(I)yrinic acid a,c-diamide adenosyltransferase [Bdellovibrio sp.]
MKIYTKSGDRGQTSLVGGTRVYKSCERLDAYGEMDEVNSWIGYILSFAQLPKDQEALLVKLQEEIFVMGSWMACEPEKRGQIKLPMPNKGIIEEIEKNIDKLEEGLSPLTNFILPGGSQLAALTHILRTIIRRTERRIVSLIQNENDLSMEDFVVVLNRLSDYLFVLARKINKDAKIEENKWIPKK